MNTDTHILTQYNIIEYIEFNLGNYRNIFAAVIGSEKINMNNLSRIELHDCKRTLQQLHELCIKTALQEEILSDIDHKLMETVNLRWQRNIKWMVLVL